MKAKSSEKGQALILIVFGIVALIGITALAVDGGIAYANRQDAKNATDSAALAGGLAHARGNDINTAAMNQAATNTYNNDGTTNTVTVAVADTPAGECPGNQPGKDITVTITAKTDTYFGPVIGINQVTNQVTATARSCGSYNAPMILGNAVVGLRPTGTDFDAHGTPDWTITGGGIFSNSSSGSSATCGGSAGVTSPSATAVGGSNLNSCGVNNANITRGATQLQPSDYTSLLPRVPACNGTATLSGGQWHPQSGRDGSNVAFSGDMDFESGLYCVTNSPGPFHGQIIGYTVKLSGTTNIKINYDAADNYQAPVNPQIELVQ